MFCVSFRDVSDLERIQQAVFGLVRPARSLTKCTESKLGPAGWKWKQDKVNRSRSPVSSHIWVRTWSRSLPSPSASRLTQLVSLVKVIVTVGAWHCADPPCVLATFSSPTVSYSEGPMTVKMDLLQCTPADLSFGLCRFIKEVRRPNGKAYEPDSIYYLCLGIQQVWE